MLTPNGIPSNGYKGYTDPTDGTFYADKSWYDLYKSKQQTMSTLGNALPTQQSAPPLQQTINNMQGYTASPAAQGSSQQQTSNASQSNSQDLSQDQLKWLQTGYNPMGSSGYQADPQMEMRDSQGNLFHPNYSGGGMAGDQASNGNGWGSATGYNKDVIAGKHGNGDYQDSYDANGKYIGRNQINDTTIKQGLIPLMMAAGPIAATVAGVGGAAAGAAGAGAGGGASAVGPGMAGWGADLGTESLADLGLGGAGGAGGAYTPWEDGFEGTGAISGPEAIPGAGTVDMSKILTGAGAAAGGAGGGGLESTLGKLGNGAAGVLGGTNGGNKSNSGGGFNLGDLLSGLYSANAQKNNSHDMLDWMNKQMKSIDDLYGADSPETKLMKQEMERKDAAAGRNSQYGTRAVELAGKIATEKARQKAVMANAMQGNFKDAFQMDNNQWAGLVANLSKGGGLNFGSLVDGGKSLINGITGLFS